MAAMIAMQVLPIGCRDGDLAKKSV